MNEHNIQFTCVSCPSLSTDQSLELDDDDHDDGEVENANDLVIFLRR